VQSTSDPQPVIVTADPIRILPVSSLPRSVGRGRDDVIVLVAIRKCRVCVWIRIGWLRAATGRVSANSERRFATIQNEGNNEILLVAEMAGELADKCVARRRIAVPPPRRASASLVATRRNVLAVATVTSID
jgi:hypothetical protein